MSDTEVRSTASRRTAPSTPRPLYAFIVVAMAVYALGVIICRPPVSGHIAVSTVTVSGASTTIDIQSIRRAISNDNLLRAALRRAGPPSPDAAGAVFPTAADLASTKASLGVVAGDTPRQVKVTFLGREAGYATRVADAVTTAVIAGAGATGAAPLQGEAEVAGARAAEARAQQALNEFIERKFAGGASVGNHAMLIPSRLPRTGKTTIERTAWLAEDGSPAEEEDGASAGEDINPARTALLRQLDALFTERDNAGADAAAVERIDAKIAVVRRALKQTPRTTDLTFDDGQINTPTLELSSPVRSAPAKPALQNPAPASPALESPAPADPAPQKPGGAVSGADAETLRKLTLDLNQARRKRVELEKALRQVSLSNPVEAGPQMFSTPAISGSTGKTPFSMVTATVIAGLAMFSGLFVAVLTPRRNALKTFSTVEDVEMLTGVKVVGAIATPEHRPPSRPATGRAALSQGVTAVAEATLAVLLLTVLFLSLLDNSIIEQLAADPLAAVSDMVARIIAGRF